MGAGSWFWVVFVVLFLFGGFLYYPFEGETRRSAGVSLVLMVLIGLLGWGVFGPPLK